MWGKVKFSHLCVILFTKGEGLHRGEFASRGFASGQSASGGSESRGVCLQEGGLHPGGLGRPPRIHGILQVGLHPGGGLGRPSGYMLYYRIWSTSGWYVSY